MQHPQIKFTYRDYLLLPEQDRRELIEGDFYVVPAPSLRHQEVLANLAFALRVFVKKNVLGRVYLAPVDVVLSDEDVVQPDIVFVSEERREILSETNIVGAPDLVIEILSPSTADRDKNLKLSLYVRAGVREYWIVDPVEETVQVVQVVQVLELGPRGYDVDRTYSAGKVSSSVLPGSSIEIGHIFA